MHLLRVFLFRLGILVALGIAVLMITARWIDVDRYRAPVVDQINRMFPAHVSAERMKLTLFPRLGVDVLGIAVTRPSSAASAAPLLVTSKARIWVEWASLLSARRVLWATLPEARISLTETSHGVWDLQAFLPGAAPPPEPTPVPRRARAEPTPSSKILSPKDIPTIPPPPPPERSSVFEGLTLHGARVNHARITFAPQGASPVSIEVEDLSVEFLPEAWKLTARTYARTPTYLGPALERCAPAGHYRGEWFRSMVTKKKIELQVSLQPQGEPWAGTIAWNGDVSLLSSGGRLGGSLRALRCESQIR